MDKKTPRFFGLFPWILLIITSLNFFNTGSLRYYFGAAVCLLALSLFFFKDSLKSISSIKKLPFIILILFSIFYGVTTYLYGFTDINKFLMYAVSPPCFYLVGYYLSTRSGDDRYKYLIWAIVIVALTSYAFLCVFNTIRTIGYIVIPNSGARNAIDIWTGLTVNATLIGVYISLGISMLALVFMRVKNRFEVLIKTLLLLAFLACAYCEYYLANRSAIVVGTVAFVATVVIINFKKPAFLKVIFIVALIGAALYVGFQNNYFASRDRWESSPFAVRFAQTSVTHDPRFETWRQASQGMIAYPKGGKATFISYDYAHNLWLDVGYNAGVGVFSLLVIFTLFVIYDALRSYRTNLPELFKAILVASFLSFLLTCFVEPIILGCFTYFLAFCFLGGFLNFQAQQPITRQAKLTK